MRAGQDLFTSGINNSHSGNMSMLLDSQIIITRTQSQLHRLEIADLIQTSPHYRDAASRRASADLEIHRRIYQDTGHRAAIHAHTPHAVALSFRLDRIEPIDVEGKYYFEYIPIVDPMGEVGTPRLAGEISKVLRNHPILVIRGHGTVAAGPTLNDALQNTTMVEAMCRLMFLDLNATALGPHH